MWNTPRPGASHEWDAGLRAVTGFDEPQLHACLEAHLKGFFKDKPLACRSLASGLRGRSITLTLLFKDVASSAAR